MQFVVSPLAASSTKDKVGTLSSVLATLQEHSSSSKSVRAALRDLVLYRPSVHGAGPLLARLLGEFKSPSKCFQLLAFHVITHSPFTRAHPDLAALVPEIARTVANFERPVRHQGVFLRVLHHLAQHTPRYADDLAALLGAVLSADAARLGGAKKKRQAKESLAALARCTGEALDVLAELPAGGVARALQGGALAQAAANLAHFGEDAREQLRRQLARFAARVARPPDALLELLPPAERLCAAAGAVPVLVGAPARFAAAIDAALAGDAAPALALLQLRLVRAEGPSDRLLASLDRCTAPVSFSALVPLMQFLMRRPLAPLGQPAVLALYRAADGPDQLLAFYALICLSLLTTEHEWLRASVAELLKRAPFTQRVAMVTVLLTVLEAAVANEGTRPWFWRLLSELLLRFGEAVDPTAFIRVIEKVAEGGEADALLALAGRVVEGLPSTETIVLLIFCLQGVRARASQDAFQAFLAALKPLVDTSDPLLRSFYEMTFVSDVN
jgi:hypothetical protein